MELALEQEFRHYLCQHLTQSPQVETEFDLLLKQRLSLKAQHAIALADLTFQVLPGHGHITVAHLRYKMNATIAHAKHWDELNELCKQIHLMAGIRTLYIQGCDLKIICCLKGVEANQWVRESL